MRTNLFFKTILLASALIFTLSSSSIQQEKEVSVTYSCRTKDFRVTLDYNANFLSSSALRLEYKNGSVDTFGYASCATPLNRHEFQCKKSGNSATIPTEELKLKKDCLTLSLHIEGEEKTLILDKCDTGLAAFVFDPTAGNTNIRNTPKGKVVRGLTKEGEYMLRVCDETKGWWRICSNEISAYLDDFEGEIVAHESGNSWIHYSVIAMSTRNYGGETLQLREHPSQKARTLYSFNEEIFLRPLKVKGDWVKVETVDKKQRGWIEVVWLCGNPLTNCS